MSNQVASPTSVRWLDAYRAGYLQIGMASYLLLCVAVIAQASTILITWQLWEVRSEPPHMPLVSISEFPFGVLMLVSLVGLLIDPRRGFVLHVLLMTLACLMDQFRMQPQFLANIVLMLAALGRSGQLVCYWFLTAMWFWAGMHKLLSPDWFAHASYWVLDRAELGRDTSLQWHSGFAWLVALSELGLGIMAWIRPRLSAIFCVLLHVGIVIMLLAIKWNYSVIPWNLATAWIGATVLFQIGSESQSGERTNRAIPLQITLAALLLVLPIGFYFSLFDHGYSNVLYSDHLPRARITGKTELRTIRGWDKINVPFPSERRTLRQFFELVAQPGDKLHIHDPRVFLDDQYFVMTEQSTTSAISSDEFFESSDECVAGIAIDDRYSVFHLRQWGEITKKYYQGNSSSRQNLVSFAYTFSPEHFQPERLLLLQGLPNLEELQLRGCPVVDADLEHLSHLSRLTGVGLNATGITDAGLKHLENLPRLEFLETDDTQISPSGRDWLRSRLKFGD